LRDLERHAYSKRIQRLLAEDAPVFEPFDPPDWETSYYNPAESVESLLADYAQLRAAELQLLRPLTPAGWARAGRHLTLGTRTVQWWAERALAYAEDRLRELRNK
jgi:hypothetical protein